MNSWYRFISVCRGRLTHFITSSFQITRFVSKGLRIPGTKRVGTSIWQFRCKESIRIRFMLVTNIDGSLSEDASEPVFLKTYLLTYCMCLHLWSMHMWSMHMCRSQKTTYWIGSLFSSCGSPGSNSGHQVWYQVPLPSDHLMFLAAGHSQW